jgi:tRNA (guanine-N7-)-methyltransferase
VRFSSSGPPTLSADEREGRGPTSDTESAQNVVPPGSIVRQTRSILDPEFQYPPSRNPYWKKLEEFSHCAFGDHRPEELRGQWRTLSSLPSPSLHVEIGCNGGHVLLEWAKRDPKSIYVGIDWKLKQVYRAAEKVSKHAIRNAFFARAFAERIHFMFAAGEVDHLYLFFPDPWPKKSQLKNRIFQPDWLRRCAGIVRPGGTFSIKTDHAGYAEHMRDVIQACQANWELTDESQDLHASNPRAAELKIPEVTLFERLFIKDGIPIHSYRLARRMGPCKLKLAP